MSSERLLDEIGLIEDEIIDEAENYQPKVEIQSKNSWKWFVAAAIVCLAIGLILYMKSPMRGIIENHTKGNSTANQNNNKDNSLAHGNNDRDNNKDGKDDEKNSKPTNTFHVDNIKYSKVNNPSKLEASFASEGAGGGAENFGWIVVRDYSEVATKNPTRNNTEGIKELPVFKNVKTIYSYEYIDYGNIDHLIYFDHPVYEKTYYYSFYGDRDGEKVCYKYDPSKSITDQLLDYSFYRIETSENTDVKDSLVMVVRPSFEAGTLYPIISLEEAKKKLRSGKFFSYGQEETFAKTADILSVELIYRYDDYQKYIQPFYMFYITDTSWSLKDIMWCRDKFEFKSVSPIFVPAVKDKYLKIVDPKVYLN